MTDPAWSARFRQLPADKRALAERLLRARAGQPRQPAAVPPVLGEAALQSFSSSETRTKTGTRQFYDAINDQIDATEFGEHAAFLNYGYVADGTPRHAAVELPAHVVNRTSVNLVLELVGRRDLAGARVLDVGCGRGGTLAVIDQHFASARKTGIDLSSSAIRYCRRAHRARPIFFLNGDAERLPLATGSHDVVTNLESSHSYPEIASFYGEVHRVLAPGGWFLYGDVFPPDDFAARLDLLRQTGFAVEDDRDITNNVVLSCIENGQRRAAVFDALGNPGMVAEFLSTPGSGVFEEMRSRRALYRIVHLRRLE